MNKYAMRKKCRIITTNDIKISIKKIADDINFRIFI